MNVFCESNCPRDRAPLVTHDKSAIEIASTVRSTANDDINMLRQNGLRLVQGRLLRRRSSVFQLPPADKDRRFPRLHV